MYIITAVITLTIFQRNKVLSSQLEVPFHNVDNQHVIEDHPRTLVKNLNEASEVLLTIDIWSNRQMRSYIGIIVHFISNEKLHNAMLA